MNINTAFWRWRWGALPYFRAHHRCEAAYKNCGKAATITPPPFGTAYHLSTRKRWHIEPSGQRPVNLKNLSFEMLKL